MQFAPAGDAALALFAASANGSDKPRPVSAPTWRKLRRLTPSQSRERPVARVSMSGLLAAGRIQAGSIGRELDAFGPAGAGRSSEVDRTIGIGRIAIEPQGFERLDAANSWE